MPSAVIAHGQRESYPAYSTLVLAACGRRKYSELITTKIEDPEREQKSQSLP